MTEAAVGGSKFSLTGRPRITCESEKRPEVAIESSLPAAQCRAGRGVRHVQLVVRRRPHDPADALDVLRYTREFVEGYMSDDPRPEARTVRLVRDNDEGRS